MIDSQDKRASALRMGWLPQPDGSLNTGDRYQLLWQYRLDTTPSGVTAFDIQDALLQIGITRAGTGILQIGSG